MEGAAGGCAGVDTGAGGGEGDDAPACGLGALRMSVTHMTMNAAVPAIPPATSTQGRRLRRVALLRGALEAAGARRFAGEAASGGATAACSRCSA